MMTKKNFFFEYLSDLKIFFISFSGFIAMLVLITLVK